MSLRTWRSLIRGAGHGEGVPSEKVRVCARPMLLASLRLSRTHKRFVSLCVRARCPCADAIGSCVADECISRRKQVSIGC